MTTQTAIAQKLNIAESAIIRIEEWSNVLFVVIKGIGARFVSKKVKETENYNFDKIKFPQGGSVTATSRRYIKAGLKMVNGVIGSKWSSPKMEFELVELNSEGGKIKEWRWESNWSGSEWRWNWVVFKF